MKKAILYFLVIICILFSVVLLGNKEYSFAVDYEQFKSDTSVVELTTGTYTSKDGHTLNISSATKAVYDNTYNLTITASNRGSLIKGNIGSNSKAVNFYQVNSSTIVSGTSVTYTHNSATTYLYEYTVFRLSGNDSSNESGKIELYHDNNLVGKYTSFQAAIDYAGSGDTIKLIDNIDVLGGAYINKNLTIDGNGKKLNYATWSNSVFIVEEEATLTLKDLTIDGGSTGFKVDYEAVTFEDYKIPLVSNSDATDIKQNLSAIITKGKLITNNLEVNNTYSTSGAALNIIRGEAVIKNSSFKHNRSTTGGAVYIGGTFKSGQTDYPVTNVEFNGVDFDNNYASANAGAMYIISAGNVLLENSNFNNNVTNNGYGGAILIDKKSTKVGSKTYYSPSHAAGLDFTKLKIKTSNFINNWTGNDGSAIQNYDAEIDVIDSTFKNNVGVHPTSSVGTISYYVYRQDVWSKQNITGSVFEKNEAPTSVIGDHGTMVILNVDDTKFIENSGWQTISFYTGLSTFKNCEFIRDKSTKNASIYLLSYDFEEYYEGSGYNRPTLEMIDTSFEGGQAPFDVYAYLYPDGSDYVRPEVIVKGSVLSNIDLNNGSILNIYGNLRGTIQTDYQMKVEDHIVYNTGSSFDGNIIARNTLITYIDDQNNEVSKQIALDPNKKITPYYVTSVLGLEKEGYMMYYYTDQEYTSKWNYEIALGTELYGRWEEHAHDYTNYYLLDNMIYEECSCGKLRNKLALDVLDNLKYDGEAKPIIVINETELSETDYELVYFKKEEDTWKEINSIPVDVGEYKAVLSINGLNIEKEYKITEQIKNPVTGITMKTYLIILVLLFVSILFVLIKYKKRFNRFEKIY